jgi:hypothetical protein
MPSAYDLKLALTRVIEPTGGPGAELATLEDAARFVGLMRPWRQARPHRDFSSLPGRHARLNSSLWLERGELHDYMRL